MSSDVTFRFAEEKDLDSILRLFEQAFNRVISGDYYRWQFFDTPHCPLSSVVAECDRRIVAHAGFTARAAVLNGEERLVFLRHTSMSSPEVRGTGIYSRLMDWAKARLRDKGAALLLAYPNANLHPLRILRDDYYDIYQIPALVRYPSKHASRHTAPFPGRRMDGQLDDEYATLSTAFPKTVAYGLLRTREYLAWRYAIRPDMEYHLLEERLQGRVKGALIWKSYPAAKPDRIMVLECLTPPDGDALDALLSPLEEYADAHGMSVRLWCNVQNDKRRHKHFERRGYVMGEPIIYFGAFPLIAPEKLPGFADYRNWHIAMGDVDIF
jgi:GNAT superfamily N-acetyltransferase